MIRADTYNLKYDAENRLVEVKKNSVVIATFTGVYPEPVEGTATGNVSRA